MAQIVDRDKLKREQSLKGRAKNAFKRLKKATVMAAEFAILYTSASFLFSKVQFAHALGKAGGLASVETAVPVGLGIALATIGLIARVGTMAIKHSKEKKEKFSKVATIAEKAETFIPS